MKIDNYNDCVKSYLKFETPDDFYILQLFLRRKDGVDIQTHCKLVDQFFITSSEMYDRIKDQVKAVCDLKGCRAYLNLNPKSKKKTALKMMSSILSMVEADDFSKVLKQPLSAAEASPTQKGRSLFLLDVDNVSSDEFESVYSILMAVAQRCWDLHGVKDTHFTAFATVSGMHIVTTPFDTKVFQEELKKKDFKHEVEIKHNSSMLLYANVHDFKPEKKEEKSEICPNCGSKLMLKHDYSEDNIVAGRIETDGDYWKCPNEKCNVVLVPYGTCKLVDDERNRRVQNALKLLSKTKEDLKKNFATTDEAYAFLDIAKSDEADALFWLKAFCHKIELDNELWWLRASLDKFKKSEDGNISIEEIFSSAVQK